MKKSLPFIFTLMLVLFNGGMHQAFAVWDTSGVVDIPDEILPSDPVEEERALETMNPSNLSSGTSAGINVASGASASTTLERMASIRTDSLYAKSSLSPAGPAGNTSASNILRAPGSWGKIYGTWGDQNDIGNQSGFNYDVGGFMFGYDIQSANNWLFGINGGYSYTDLDSGVNTNTDIDTLNVGLYASYSKGQLYVDYGILYSRGDIENDRSIFTSLGWIGASSDTDSEAYTAYLEVGQQFPFPNYILTPFINVMYSKVTVDKYTEKTPLLPAAGLIVDDVDDEFYSTTIGLKAEYMLDNVLHLKGRISWSHEFSDDLQSTAFARFNSPGTSFFTTEGIDIDDDRFGLGIGMKYMYGPNLIFDVDYDLELAKDFDSHTGTLGMKYNF